MRITVGLGPLCLSYRGSLDLATCRQDSRGMSGTDYGTLRIAECLRDLGHEVTIRTVSPQAGTTWERITVVAPEVVPAADAVVAINEPALLADAPAGAFRACMTWLNDWSFCPVGFDKHVDLFASCSAPHLEQFRTNPAWHRVQVTPDQPNGAETFRFDESRWTVIPLGCDPERLGGREKVPGRVVYCSSPDRGLHWLLQEWPAIKSAVPHATLRVFYRTTPWLRQWDSQGYYPPIEAQRTRGIYIDECLRRFAAVGGMGVTLCDSVSRDRIEEEVSLAETHAYPCDTTTWSEGFSCSIMECCAAQACPIVTDCDALGEIYSSVEPTPRHGEWVGPWRDRVIKALLDPDYRAEINAKALELATRHTWAEVARRLVVAIEERR